MAGQGKSTSPEHERIQRRFAVALQLYELAEAMLRQKLRRDHPEWSDADIDEGVRVWLRRRPGAEHGDAVGRPVAWPRRPPSERS